MGTSEMQLLAAVRADSYAVIGLSISVGDDIDRLKALIRRLRENSKNPRVKVLVGGPLLGLEAGLELRVGADAGAVDSKVTQKLARALALPIDGDALFSPIHS
jgi:methanogenic corrinoid protein MtbC1